MPVDHEDKYQPTKSHNNSEFLLALRHGGNAHERSNQETFQEPFQGAKLQQHRCYQGSTKGA